MSRQHTAAQLRRRQRIAAEVREAVARDLREYPPDRWTLPEEEHRYVLTIMETIQRVRVRPLFALPLEHYMARAWYAAGYSLVGIVEAIHQARDRRENEPAWAGDLPLRYVRPFVDAVLTQQAEIRGKRFEPAGVVTW